MESPTKRRIALLGSAIGLFALGVVCYFVLLPAVQVKRGLRLLAAVNVGQTGVDEFRTMAVTYGVRVDEGSSGFGLLQHNSVLEHLHLAPHTSVLLEARVTDGVVSGISVRAGIGDGGEFAKISIDEVDSHHSRCGDVPVCVTPTSETNRTYVFFVPSTPVGQREHLLSLNSWCLAKVLGCRSSREFFPAAWEHQSQ